MAYADEGDIRLNLGETNEDGTAEYGRLEIFYQGGWGTVCGKTPRERLDTAPNFREESATVACRQLGYTRGMRVSELVRDYGIKIHDRVVLTSLRTF